MTAIINSKWLGKGVKSCHKVGDSINEKNLL
jgi:hypothetical protein